MIIDWQLSPMPVVDRLPNVRSIRVKKRLYGEKLIEKQTSITIVVNACLKLSCRRAQKPAPRHFRVYPIFLNSVKLSSEMSFVNIAALSSAFCKETSKKYVREHDPRDGFKFGLVRVQ